MQNNYKKHAPKMPVKLLYMCTMKELRMSQNATAFVTSINLWCLVKVIPTIKADRQPEKIASTITLLINMFHKGLHD